MKETIKINVKPVWKISKGHSEHRGGAGLHEDRRTKRARTRSAKIRKILQEYP